jgi:ribosome recycling factor
MINLADFRTKMEEAIKALEEKFSGVRTGRPSPKLLESLLVSAYGSKTALSHVATINVGNDGRSLTIQVWDNAVQDSVEKAIRESNLGINPINEGTVLRVRLPDLTQERREELEKLVKNLAENIRVALRNIRRECNEAIDIAEKNGVSEDEASRKKKECDEMTSQFVKKVDELLKKKTEELYKIA